MHSCQDNSYTPINTIYISGDGNNDMPFSMPIVVANIDKSTLAKFLPDEDVCTLIKYLSKFLWQLQLFELNIIITAIIIQDY